MKWVGYLIAAVAVVAIGWLYSTAVINADENEEFKHICEYNGGRVEGDVCIEGNNVILEKSDVIE